MNPDVLMIGAMLAAGVFFYAVGRLLLPQPIRVRARWHPVKAWRAWQTAHEIRMTEPKEELPTLPLKPVLQFRDANREVHGYAFTFGPRPGSRKVLH